MFFIFQPIYLQQLGANPQTIGWILGAAGLVTTVVPIPSGYISDLWGRQTLLMALATSLFVFVLGILLYGITLFVVSPLDSYLTAARGNWSVGRVITYSGIVYNAGAMIGPFTGE